MLHSHKCASRGAKSLRLTCCCVFILCAGQLAKGSNSLSVESGLYRALAHPYDPSHTDFLLLRSPVSLIAAEMLGVGWDLCCDTQKHNDDICLLCFVRCVLAQLSVSALQAGTMQLREVNGTVIVGQELPMLRVPAPTAREVK